jgi:O-antigen/teichoic acid export membrane protein
VFRKFLHNTAVSAVAYGIAGVLGLFAVGLIARSYGLAVLGLIVLVRVFLPTGFLAVIDLGVSELTTQAVARGRVGDWSVASEKFSLLTTIAALAGLAAGVALWIGAAPLAILFKVASEQRQAFVSILTVTALILPITFLGLVAEGVLKGFEEYEWLRLTEVVSTALYVVAIYASVLGGAAFEWLAYSYLATIIAKYLVLAVVTFLLARSTPLRFSQWSDESRRDVMHRCWLMFRNRIAGILQQPVVPLAIGVLYSPTEVGAYDLITRLPRFLKTSMAPLYSAILPLSTQIEETADARRLQILGRNGLVLPAAAVAPVLVVIALFSKEILTVWVGPQHADQWPWLALSLFVPALSLMLGAGQTALMVRSDFLRLITRYLYLQVLTQYLVTVAALIWFRENAFILGWVVSYLVFAPLIAHRILSFMDLPGSLFWEQVGRQTMVAAILAAMVATYKFYSAPSGLAALVIVGTIGCIAAWALSVALILSQSDRAMVGRIARAIVQRK